MGDSILRLPLSTMDVMILRNIIDGERMRGVTLENQKDHDAALIRLMERGLVTFHRFRKNRKFNVTQVGREQLKAAESNVNGSPGAVGLVST